MRTHLALTALLCLIATPSRAENPPPVHHHPRPPAPQVIAPKTSATAVGTGVGIANSSSQSGAVAISGQGGQGGQGGNSSSSLTVNNPANTSATVNSNVSGTTTQNLNQTVSGSTTSNVNQRVSGTTTVKNVPSTVAPSLAAAGLETCLGSASGTVSAVGFGIGGGSTYTDEGCQARLDSRTLYAYGLKAAAVARLCQRADIWRSMPDICAQYWPVGMPYPAGIAVAPAEYQSGLPVKALMSASGGSVESIRVINGVTGREGDCLNYSAAKQKCYQWAGEPTVRPKRHAAVAPTRSVTPEKSKENTKPPPPTAVAEP